ARGRPGQLAPGEVARAGDVAGARVEIHRPLVLLLRADVEERVVAALYGGQVGAPGGIEAHRERGWLGHRGTVDDRPAGGAPGLVEDVQEADVRAAEILQHPDEQRAALAIVAVVDDGRQIVAQPGGPQPGGELVRWQERAIWVEGARRGDADRARQVPLQVAHGKAGV